jgi:hypothetical protein
VYRFLLGLILGAAAAALALHLFGDDGRADDAQRMPGAADTSIAAAPFDRDGSAVAQPETRSTGVAPDVQDAGTPTVDSWAGSSAEVAAPVKNPAAEVPGGVLDEIESAGEREPLESLLGSFRVDCLYGPGAGGNWPNGRVFPHTAAWQGGFVTLDTIDIAANKARLKASSGFTRTQDGELDVRVTATDTGLHFTVFAPGGELIVASVYAALDADRKHRAVITFHGVNLNHESAQFYGAFTAA